MFRNLICSLALVVAFVLPVKSEDELGLKDNLFHLVVVGPSSVVKERGTGFLISTSGFVITAKHVLEGYDPKSDQLELYYKARDGIKIQAHVFDCDPGTIDLCLLYINSENLSSLGVKKTHELACRMPQDQEDISAIGFPPGNESPSITVTGKVSSSVLGVGQRVYSSAGFVSGMSGGPVFDKNKNVIGVVYGAAGDGSNIALFTPIIFGKPLISKTPAECSAGTKIVASQFPSSHATTTSRDLVPSAAAQPLKVYIQVGPGDIEPASRVQASLRSIGVFAPGVEEMDKPSQLPDHSEIRFFNEEDRESANSVKVVAEKATDVKFILKKVSSLKAPPGLLEIWFGKH